MGFRTWLEGKISPKEAGRIITSRGREEEFTVTFQKSNGKIRVLRGMYGIKPEKPSGAGMKYSPSEKNMVLVSDMDILNTDGVDKAYRTIALKNIIELEIGDEKYDVD